MGIESVTWPQVALFGLLVVMVSVWLTSALVHSRSEGLVLLAMLAYWCVMLGVLDSLFQR